MSLITTIKAEQISARKQHLTAVASVLTTLIGEAEMIGKNNGNREVTDSEVQALIKKFIKNNNETIAALGDNDPRTLEFMGENVTLEKFLPKQFTNEQVRLIVEAMKERGMSNMGEMMKHLKAEYDGQYDGKVASAIIKAALA